MISDMPCRFVAAITVPSTFAPPLAWWCYSTGGSVRRGALRGNSLIVLRDAFRLLACTP